jgi:hypothetical protein
MPNKCNGRSVEVASGTDSSAGGETLIYIIDELCAWGSEQVAAPGSNATAVGARIPLKAEDRPGSSISL